MMTWLDYYVQGALALVEAAGLSGFESDVEAMTVLSAMRLGKLSARGRTRVDSDDMAAATLMSCVHAITASATSDPKKMSIVFDAFENEAFAKTIYTVKAIRPSEELVAILKDARAPETSDWRAPLQSATWYFDIPHKTLFVGAQIQVRAIFTQPTQKGEIAVVCVLTPPGRNQYISRLAWIWGANQPVYGFRDETIDPDVIRGNLERFLRLLVLYERSASRVEYVPIPRIDVRTAAKLKPKKLKARLKKASIFTIRDLRPPKDRFGRRMESRERQERQGWRLERAVEVRGHFKWQPHGPKLSKRKLVWIDAYTRGPKACAPKPVLEIIDAEDKHREPGVN